MEQYEVYIKTDDDGCIIAVNSNAFLHDREGWTKIDAGEGVRCLHAQGNYFPKPIRTELGVYRYRLVDGAVQELSDEEIAAMEQAILAAQVAKPSQMDLIEAQVAYTAMMTDTLLEV
jgi:hypothetical protein